MYRSIRWRLVVSYILLTALAVSVVGVLALSMVKRYIDRQEQEYLAGNAEAVAHQALPLLQPVTRQGELRELVQTSALLSNARVRVLDQERNVLADSATSAEDEGFVWVVMPGEWRSGMGGEGRWSFIVAVPRNAEIGPTFPWVEHAPFLESLPSDLPLTLVRWRDGAWGRHVEFDVLERVEQTGILSRDEDEVPRSDRVVVVPIGDAGRPEGYVEVSRGPNYGIEALSTTRRAFLLAAAGATLIAALVGLLISRGLSLPLRRLAAAAGEMSEGDLSIRARVRGRDEIGQLAGQFNRMAERLEASFSELAAERDALRRFITDASHELRTPITALKSFNDLLQGAAAEDPAARAEFLAESQVQLDRLEWITRDLLDLSRFDAGLVALDMGDHSAAALLEAALSAFQALVREKGIALLVSRPEPPLTLRCDRARIELALSNLVDNALKFTSAGGEVEVGAGEGADTVRLWVRDTGSGIDPADQPRIFERFYRGRNGPQGGSGLGLAIVQSIVRAHGGRVSVESEPGAGSLFVIELPRG